MGIENNYVVIATTWSSDKIAKVHDWCNQLEDEQRSFFSFTVAPMNSMHTVLLAPSGSKVGWDDAVIHAGLRDKFIEILKSFDNCDGSNSFKFVEVAYGELGQQILQGNCVNKYV